MRKALSNLRFALSIVGFAGVVLFTVPAMAVPIAVSKGVAAIVPVDGSEIVQVRAARGGYRGGAAVRRGGAAYRGGPWLEGERWLDGEQWQAGPTTAAPAIVIRTIKIAAQAATMVVEFIEGARSSEGALLCEAERQYVGGARMLPIVVTVVADADGK